MEIQKTVAMVFGAVLGLVGVLGFFMNPILGLFPVNVLHNLVHIVSGALGLTAAHMGRAVDFNKWFGVVYLVVAALGLILELAGVGLFTTLLNTNMADHILHLLIGGALVGVGFGVKE